MSVRGAASDPTADEWRDVLVAVYGALGIAFEPATAGALEDVAPGVVVEDVLAALRRLSS